MSDVNYLLLFTGDSGSGGDEVSVRGFYSIDAARAAMQEAYKKMAEAVRLPAPLGAHCDRYTVKMSIANPQEFCLEYNSIFC